MRGTKEERNWCEEEFHYRHREKKEEEEEGRKEGRWPNLGPCISRQSRADSHTFVVINFRVQKHGLQHQGI